MIIYYLGLSFIFLLFLMVVFFLLKTNHVNQSGQYKGLFSSCVLVVSAIVVGYGYYHLGAMTPLKSLYAYRDIHDLLTTLQKSEKTTSDSIEHALNTMYDTLPQTEYVHAKMGEVYLALNFRAEAQMAYQQAVTINPQNRDYLYGFYYAQSLNSHGELPDKSVQALVKLIDVFPKDNGFLNILAVHYFQSAQYKNAIEYWKKIKADNAEEANLIQEMVLRANTLQGNTVHNTPSIKLTIKWAYPGIKKYPVIFIVAKYPNQSMPVLVKKLLVSQDIQFGQEQVFMLTNQDAMDPNRKITKGQKLIISVRSSITGSVDKTSEDKVVESQALLIDSDKLDTKIIF